MPANRTVISIEVFQGAGYGVDPADEVQHGGSNLLHGSTVTHLGTAATEKSRLGHPRKITFEIQRGSPWAWQNLLRMRMRLLVTYSDSSKRMYRVKDVEPDATGVGNTSVEAWDIWSDLGELHLRYVRTPLADVTYQYPISKITVEDVLQDIIFNTDYGLPQNSTPAPFFNVSSIDTSFATTVVSVPYAVTKILPLIRSISDHVNERTELSFEMEATYNAVNNQVDLDFVQQVGLAGGETAASPNPDLRPIRGPGKLGEVANRVQNQYNDEQGNYYSRIVPFSGPDEELVGIGGVWWDIDSYDGAGTFTVEAGAVPFDDVYVSDPGSGATFWVEVDNIAPDMTSDTGAQITGMDADLNTITVAVHDVDYAVSTKLRIYSTIAGNVSGATVPGSYVTWIPDPVAEAETGVVEASETWPEVPPYANLFEEEDDGEGDMSTWAAPTGGTVRGVSSLPQFMLVRESDLAYKAAIRKTDSDTREVIIAGNWSGLSVGDTVSFAPNYDGWFGEYEIESVSYDSSLVETTLTMTLASMSGVQTEEITDYVPLQPDSATRRLTIDGDHITVAQATGRRDAINGTISIKVTADIRHAGVRTEAITFDRTVQHAYLSVWASLRVDSGTVKLQVEDAAGNVYPPVSGSDQAFSRSPSLQGISIEGIEFLGVEVGQSTTFHVSIFADEPNTVFYVDALSVTASPTAWEFRQYMGPKDLYRAAARELKRSGGLDKFPYRVAFYDMTFLDPGGGFAEVLPGSWVRLLDQYDEGSDTYLLDRSVRAVEVSETYNLIDGNYHKECQINPDRPTLENRLVLEGPSATIPTRKNQGELSGGSDGIYVDFIFIRSDTAPSDPNLEANADTLPDGWSHSPPDENGQHLWMSKAYKDADSTLAEGASWSDPARLSHSAGPVVDDYDIYFEDQTSHVYGELRIDYRLAGGGDELEYQLKTPNSANSAAARKWTSGTVYSNRNDLYSIVYRPGSFIDWFACLQTHTSDATNEPYTNTEGNPFGSETWRQYWAETTIIPTAVEPTDASELGSEVYYDPDTQTGTNRLRINLSANGLKMWLATADGTPSTIYEYDLGTAWDISSATYNGNSLDLLSDMVGQINGFHVADGGTKLFVCDCVSDTSTIIRRYTLSTANDITSAGVKDHESSNITSQIQFAQGVRVSPDGMRLFIGDDWSGNWVSQYDLSTAWDVSTVAGTADATSYVGNISLRGIAFNSTGENLYVCGATGTVIERELTPAWDISNLRQTQQWSGSTLWAIGGCHGLWVSENDERLYFVDEVAPRDVAQLDFSLSFDYGTQRSGRISGSSVTGAELQYSFPELGSIHLVWIRARDSASGAVGDWIRHVVQVPAGISISEVNWTDANDPLLRDAEVYFNADSPGSFELMYSYDEDWALPPVDLVNADGDRPGGTGQNYAFFPNVPVSQIQDGGYESVTLLHMLPFTDSKWVPISLYDWMEIRAPFGTDLTGTISGNRINTGTDTYYDELTLDLSDAVPGGIAILYIDNTAMSPEPVLLIKRDASAQVIDNAPADPDYRYYLRTKDFFDVGGTTNVTYEIVVFNGDNIRVFNDTYTLPP